MNRHRCSPIKVYLQKTVSGPNLEDHNLGGALGASICDFRTSDADLPCTIQWDQNVGNISIGRGEAKSTSTWTPLLSQAFRGGQQDGQGDCAAAAELPSWVLHSAGQNQPSTSPAHVCKITEYLVEDREIQV